MIAVLNSKQIRALDKQNIESEQISSLDLMERAASRLYENIVSDYSFRSIIVLCGPGNNGGDGLVVARLAHADNRKVEVFVPVQSASYSADFNSNLERIKNLGIPIGNLAEFRGHKACDILIDALFGSGLNRALSGEYSKVVEEINQSTSTVISVDMPSGMPDIPSFSLSSSNCVIADMIYTFHCPKLSLLLPYSNGFYRDFKVLDIGLQKGVYEGYKYLVEQGDIVNKLVQDAKFTHKYQKGSLLLVGGSHGKAGSIILSSEAAFRTGCGLVTDLIPKTAVLGLQSRLAEAMYIEAGEDNLEVVEFDNTRFTAYGIGPGMSVNDKSALLLSELLKHNKAVVLDADALRIVGSYGMHIELKNSDAILTPHEGEFKALVGEWSDEVEKLQKLREYSIKYDCIVVLKGAHTIVCDRGTMYFNSNGDPAMATAGSGDVLLGVIASLRAQGYSAIDSAVIGVYVHALAAETYLNQNVSLTMIASDITKYIGSALKMLSTKSLS